MSKAKLFFWGLVILLCGSCTHRVLDFTLVSSKNVDLSKFSTYKKGTGRATGIDLVHWIIIVPAGTVSIKEALDKAIEGTPGCVALLDGVIYTKFWWIPYIYGQESATVEGTPLIDPSLAQETSDYPTYGKIHLRKDGTIKSTESISAEQYYDLKSNIVKSAKETRFDSSKAVE